VVLSACETQLGEQLSGDEVVSLANGFVFAGAERVVASLWRVPDEATRALLVRLYGYVHQGKGWAATLAQAQREAVQQRLSPATWAAFVLTG
jgi:CHAT domain-containing protein